MTWRPRFSLRTLAIFLLLVTSGMGLWWHWEPWVLELRFDGNYKHHAMLASFADGDSRIEIISHLARNVTPNAPKPEMRIFLLEKYVYEAATGEFLHSAKLHALPGVTFDEDAGLDRAALEKLRRDRYFSPDGRRRLDIDGGGSFDRWQWRAFIYERQTPGGLLHTLEDRKVETPECSDGYAFSSDGQRVVLTGPDKSIRIYRRRRPEWWWGVFWLWEFWLTAAFALLLSWSVWRDRRALALGGPPRRLEES